MAIDRNETNIRISATDATKDAFRSVTGGLKQLDGAVLAARASFAGLGAAAVAATFATFAKSSINAVAALDDMAEKTGLSVELLSKLEAVAVVGGHSLEALSGSASKFSKAIGEAKGGNAELLKAFEAIGVSADDLRSKNLDELFVDVARKIATAEDHTLALAVSTKLLGKSAAEQMPFLKDLAEQGLGNARVTTAQAAAAEKMQKEFGKLNLVVKDFGVGLANAVVPWLTRMLEEMNQGIIVAGGFASALRLFGTLQVASDASAQSIGQSIDVLLKDVGRLTNTIDDLSKTNIFGINTSAIANVNSQIDDALKRIEFLKLRQSAAVKRDFVGPTQDGAGFKINAEKLNDNAKKSQEALSKLFEQRAKQTAAAESALAEERIKILDGFHARGLIEEESFWNTRLSIQRDALRASIAEINLEIANRQKAIKDQFTGADAGKDVKKFSAERINAEKELEDALERRAVAERKIGSLGVENQLARTKAAEDFADTIKEIDAKQLEIEERSLAALAIRQEKQNRVLRADLETNDDLSGLAKLNRLEASENAQLAFNEAQKKGADITARLAIEEERIQNAQRVGAIGDLEALRQTGEARLATVEQLKAISAELDAIASKTGFENLKLQADQFKSSMQTLATQADLLNKKFETIGIDAFATALTDLASGTKSVKSAFTDMANSIVSEITRIIAQDFAKRLLGAGGPGGGIGGLLGLFGGAGGAGASLSSAEIASLAGAGFATGGSFEVGGSGGTDSSRVAFRATPGERVTVETPGQQRRQPTLSIVNHFSVQGTTDQSSQQQIADRVARSVMAASRRNS